MEAAAPVTPPMVQLSLEGPKPQRRVTIAFRAILAIPHAVWLFILAIVATCAIVVGWFCALVLGRLPTGIAEFLTRILRYMARTLSYVQYLITDRYPPFALQGDGYPVELDVPPPGRLNRAAVLFRIVLLVPAAFVSTFLANGIGVALVFIWLIVLITGRTPRSLFEALTAVLRYQLRFMAYAGMLTSTYPSGLFGDPAVADNRPPVGAPDQPDAPDAWAMPPMPMEPRITRLALSKAGKRIVVVILVVGILTTAGTTAVRTIASAQSATALKDFERYDDQVGAKSLQYGRDTQSCALNGGIVCLQGADRRFAEAVAQFRAQMRSIHFPDYALSYANAVDDDVADIVSALRQLARTDSPTTYQTEFATLQQLFVRVTQDERTLGNVLLRHH